MEMELKKKCNYKLNCFIQKKESKFIRNGGQTNKYTFIFISKAKPDIFSETA